MSAAERQRRRRERERRGEEVLQVPVRTNPVVEALLKSARLTEEEALDKRKVEAAVAEIVTEWARDRAAEKP
jgi:hypothetical protein